MAADDPRAPLQARVPAARRAAARPSQRARRASRSCTRASTRPTALIHSFYGKSQQGARGQARSRRCAATSRRCSASASGWDTALLRELFGALLAGAKRRRRSADHERLWLNLAGYCLRPGFGYPLDAWRVEQLWALYARGPAVRARRRRSGRSGGSCGAASRAGSTRRSQSAAARRPRLLPRAARRAAQAAAQGAQGARASRTWCGWPAASSAWLPRARSKLASGCWRAAKQERTLPASACWAIGRLGRACPCHGSAHAVVPADVAAPGLSAPRARPRAHRAGRVRGGSARAPDPRPHSAISSPSCASARPALARLPGSEAWVTLVREGGELSSAMQNACSATRSRRACACFSFESRARPELVPPARGAAGWNEEAMIDRVRTPPWMSFTPLRAPLLPDGANFWVSAHQSKAWVSRTINISRHSSVVGASRSPAFSDHAAVAASVRDWNRNMTLLDRRLEQSGAFVVGQDFTLADVVIGLSTPDGSRPRWRGLHFHTSSSTTSGSANGPVSCSTGKWNSLVIRGPLGGAEHLDPNPG